MSYCQHDALCLGPGTPEHDAALRAHSERVRQAKTEHERLLKADAIRARYRRPRKIRLRQYRAARIAQAVARNPKVDPATVKRWVR